MADISLKLRAEALGKSIEQLAPHIEEEISQAIKNLAHAAYVSIASKIQNMSANDKNRQDYLSGLKFTDLGDDSYLIHLDGEWPNKLESGFGPYSMKEVLLKSKKIVQVGPRTGMPWVQQSVKDNHKYAHVPFDHHPYRGNTGNLETDIKRLVAKNQAGLEQSITKTFKDFNGNPMDSGSGRDTKPVATVDSLPKGMSPNLMGLAKFQKVHPSGKVSSTYMTWRVISEAGKDWTHPGHKGYSLFKEAQEYVEKEMDNVINTLLK